MLLAACAHHEIRVTCDGHLTPINTLVPKETPKAAATTSSAPRAPHP